MTLKRISIAIDGPAGAGKSTIAKRVAKELEIEYIDTGAMYRALTLKALNQGLDPQNEQDIIKLLINTSIDFKNNSIFLDGENVDKEIRENFINNNVSFIARIKEVRDGMVEMQQELAKSKSVVMDGRDIGSVVLPNARFKFFITATVEERANRRYKELVEKGNGDINLNQIKLEIENRDLIDSTREIAPLKQSIDSIKIDTTDKTIENSVLEIISVIKGGN